MQYKYDDYDYYTEHEKVSIKEQQEIIEEIIKEDLLASYDKCA